MVILSFLSPVGWFYDFIVKLTSTEKTNYIISVPFLFLLEIQKLQFVFLSTWLNQHEFFSVVMEIISKVEFFAEIMWVSENHNKPLKSSSDVHTEARSVVFGNI